MGKFRNVAIPFLLLGISSIPGWSQEIEEPEPGDLSNYAYTQEVEFGGYSVGEQEVQTITAPFSYVIRPLNDENKWGFRLRFPVSVGVYNLNLPEFIEGQITLDRLSAITVVPGGEFLVPLSKRWMLKPRADLGFGKDLKGGDLILIGGGGIKALYSRPVKAVTMSVGPGVRYLFSDSSSGLNDDDFALLEAGLDTRFPLWFDIGKRSTDSSVYVVVRHYFRKLVFGQVEGEPITIDDHFEVGWTFGTDPPMRLWGVNISRIGIGYRFGESLRGIRIKFGFPF